MTSSRLAPPDAVHRLVPLATLLLALAGACARGGSGGAEAGRDAAATDAADGDASPLLDSGPADGGPPVEPDGGGGPSDAGGDADGSDGRCRADAECDDGMACNGAERCGPDGRCMPGEPPDCDDGVGCTTDRCDEAMGGCVHEPDDATCDDGLTCNGTERCAPAEPGADPVSGCVPGAPLDCDDGMPCTVDRCDEAMGGCVHESTDTDGDGYCGAEDCAEGDPDVHPMAAERCNGLDDDCDGMTDEDFECVAGSSETCSSACGTSGTRSCSASCTWSACAAAEACNGCDDDGDGSTDEGFTCALGQTRSCTVSGCTGTQQCGAGCTWGSCDLGAAPANDGCSGTVPTIAASGSFAFATCGAGADFGASCGAGAASPDVVFRLEVGTRSEVTLETVGPNFDTVLHLRSGASCPGTEIACDDDGGSGTASRIVRTLDRGTYWVVVDGFGSSNQGSGTLQATIRPVNDECANATDITLGAGRTTVLGSTVAATDSSLGCGGSAPDLWYRFTLSQTEVVHLDTFGSGYDTYLALLRSCTSATGQQCGDDACSTLQSQVTAVLPAGTYYVKVDGFGARAGDFALHVEHLPAGSSGAPVAVPSGSSTFTGTTSGTGVVDGSCRTGSAPERLYYWTQCPSAAASTVTASTCSGSTDFDTVLYLRNGVTGTDLACNDDSSCSLSSLRSRISTSVPAGSGLFGVYVDGFGSNAGSYGLSITR